MWKKNQAISEMGDVIHAWFACPHRWGMIIFVFELVKFAP